MICVSRRGCHGFSTREVKTTDKRQRKAKGIPIARGKRTAAKKTAARTPKKYRSLIFKIFSGPGIKIAKVAAATATLMNTEKKIIFLERIFCGFFHLFALRLENATAAEQKNALSEIQKKGLETRNPL
jgi:hypothetical protein